MPTDLEDAISGPLGRPLRHLATIDSTNDEALRWAASGAPHGAAVIADEQSAGRGRWGRPWLSAPGASLLMSVIVRPQWSGERLGLVTIAAGLACAEAVERTTGAPATLKWPNDVLIGGRKVAGILIETRISGRKVEAVVVGVGVDLDWPEGPPIEIAERATSLAAEARRLGRPPPSRTDVVAALLAALGRDLELLSDEKGSGELIARAAALMPDLGRSVTLHLRDGERRTVTAERLMETGALLVRSEGGTEEVHGAEIVSLRPLE